MISKENYELARPFLIYQSKERGLEFRDSRNDWDTFIGWKKRGRSILYGSEGFRVDMVVPFLIDKIKKNKRVGFVTRNKILFNRKQTF
tara:strand:- start:85 stop:348 length:264 start_codon:yes stop_codon:yes gene_type:complete